MRLIQLTKKDTPQAKAKLLRELKAAFTDKKNATVLRVSDEEEEIEAVIVPNHPLFSKIFGRVAKSKETRKADFSWKDHELEALLGLGAMQVNFREGSHVLLADVGKKGQIVFAIVSRGFYESTR
ncbi:MAG TPA: hypothetical protein VL728_00870 [Cyclobacteriaceae bacterium]|jgi:hypothetical protein|nr:hypothetical protein [Cyclobacteriaceae bacterium]